MRRWWLSNRSIESSGGNLGLSLSPDSEETDAAQLVLLRTEETLHRRISAPVALRLVRALPRMR